jgi:hypothetical protein
MTIEQRCQQRETRAFVTAETVDPLAAKMVGIIGDRRCIKMSRYLGERGGVPRLFTGLRLWHGGFEGPVRRRPQEAVYVQLANAGRDFEGVGFHANRELATEAEAAQRYHFQQDQDWFGRREDIALVVLNGWPGEPLRSDSIRIEYWNENGVGHETILVFDDVDLVQELAWDLKHDAERQVHLDDTFCTVHGQHYEDPQHRHEFQVCVRRDATLAENLALLATLAASPAATPVEAS